LTYAAYAASRGTQIWWFDVPVAAHTHEPVEAMRLGACDYVAKLDGSRRDSG
jgi:hypothetical protein